PLSFTRQWLGFLKTGQRYPDAFTVDVTKFEEPDPRLGINPNLRQIRRAYGMDREVVDGAFKTPSLRNVELTGPYFHTGGASTLEQVVEFYNRGGNRRLSDDQGDTSGFWPNASNLHPAMVPLGLTAQEQADLVAFMKSLTDERVRLEEAPFDHPQLLIPHGHQPGAHHQLGSMAAEDQVEILPAVGQQGRAPLGLPPLQPFGAGLR
ncbi:MAG: cytochrome-c peroxidase, partial [Planctomycetota bacterium]|nr:cytochrome-c peroxidase [Planctomycetota bacterium]